MVNETDESCPTLLVGPREVTADEQRNGHSTSGKCSGADPRISFAVSPAKRANGWRKGHCQWRLRHLTWLNPTRLI